MTYPSYDPAPVFFDTLGLTIKPCAGGSLEFCEVGTTTLKDTWSDPDKTVPNQNPVQLDSSGRADTHIWLDGAYTITLKNGDGVVVWVRDVDSGQGAGATIPPLEIGKFLTNDGSSLLWQSVREVPDPSGSPDYILSTDGANLIWTAQQEIPQLDVVIGAASLQLGTSESNTKFYLQKGSGSAPASGAKSTSTSVTFPKAFKELWWIGVTQTHDGVTAFATLPRQTNSAQSPTGFTTRFSTDENSTASGWNITSPVPFDWIAYGLVEEV